jgi:DamX protein
VAKPEASEPPPKPSPPPAPQPARDRLLGPEWLWAQPPEHFTLQLVGARDTTAIRKFVVRHGLEGSLAVFERELAGRPWFSLLYGSFPSREAAERQRARLPAPVRKDVWIRPFGDIRQYLGSRQ